MVRPSPAESSNHSGTGPDPRTQGVTYRDGRFFRGDEPFFVVAAEYQYYRDRRANWLDRLEKLASSGVDTITFYVPWRHHLVVEGERRRYDFTGETLESRDVVGFMERIESLGLLMIAKPGPFVHSELNIGGLPDIVSPSFTDDVPPARRHHDGPVYWTYDATQLPSPLSGRFDALVREWLEAVRGVLQPFARPDGPLIAVQLNDETIYCTSNDPPWSFGYEADGLACYRRLLEERYGSIAAYNDKHATTFGSFDEAPPPVPISTGGAPGGQIPSRREDVLRLVDWAEYQWRLRRDLYERYAGYLGLDLPRLTNFAGITPPIEENVPDLQETVVETMPAGHDRLYPEWWFAMNRIDHDSEVYHYGMISWLGVAAYDREVFDRYINTARRARGINMEENWGFGTLYDSRSRHALVPFYQTLVSVAGGATGYVIFCGVSTDFWDDDLDRITKKQCATFPSHAPIDEHGRLRPMYDAASLLNRWFAANGDALLRCRIDVDVAYLLYAPWAAVSSWIPDASFWRVEGHDIPRCGREGFEEFSRSLQAAGYEFGLFEVDAVPPERLREPRALATHSAFFMDRATQEKLAAFVDGGGALFISGELPVVDLEWRECSALAEAIERARAGGRTNVVYRRENFFAAGDFADVVTAAGLAPSARASPDLRIAVHRGDEDLFVFFFGIDDGDDSSWIDVDGRRIELELGSRTCGVLCIRDDRIASWLVKGTNEVEGVTSRVRIRLGEQMVEGRGDFSSPVSDDDL